MIDPYRGTGRTTRQLAALPDGGVYVVAHPHLRPYVEGLLVDMGRDPSAVRVLPATTAAERLKGVPVGTPIAVDHYVWEAARERDVDELMAVICSKRLAREEDG